MLAQTTQLIVRSKRIRQERTTCDEQTLIQVGKVPIGEEYGRIEETFSPNALHLMGDWILSQLAKPR
jgi:hypothetical protein